MTSSLKQPRGLTEELISSPLIADLPTPFRPRYRAIQRNQPLLAPVDPERMAKESHPVRAIRGFIGGLDPSCFEASMKAVESHAGCEPWLPRPVQGYWG